MILNLEKEIEKKLTNPNLKPTRSPTRRSCRPSPILPDPSRWTPRRRRPCAAAAHTLSRDPAPRLPRPDRVHTEPRPRALTAGLPSCLDARRSHNRDAPGTARDCFISALMEFTASVTPSPLSPPLMHGINGSLEAMAGHPLLFLPLLHKNRAHRAFPPLPELANPAPPLSFARYRRPWSSPEPRHLAGARRSSPDRPRPFVVQRSSARAYTLSVIRRSRCAFA
jgi:hypothetical protein